MSCWWLGSTIFAVLLCLGTCAAKKPSAIFVFGDSIMDVGNNNYITSLCKSNYEPNAIDFGKPTGRFTNRRTVVDILGQSLGFKNFTPSYLAPTTVGPVILQGVNYASGAAGILNETGANYVGRIPMDAQLQNFVKTRLDIISRIGAPAAVNDEILAKNKRRWFCSLSHIGRVKNRCRDFMPIKGVQGFGFKVPQSNIYFKYLILSF